MVVLLQTALSLLTLVNSNPSLPQSMRDNATAVAQHAISEASLNVLEAGGSREITDVEEERLHACHKHISVTEELAHLR